MRMLAALLKLSTLGWPWHPNSDGFPEGTEIRRRSRAARFSRFSWPQKVTLQIISAGLWPLGALYQSHWVMRTQNPQASYKWHKAYRAALKHNIPPLDYYTYGLGANDRREDYNAYIYSHERLGLMLDLNNPDYTPEEDPVQDKLAFSKLCETQDVPHPAILWHSNSNGPTRLPEADLWLKPIRGSQSAGHKLVSFKGPMDYEMNGHHFSGEDLASELKQQSNAAPLILQPRLENHKTLSGLTNGGLAVLRLVSGKNKNGEVTPIAATIHFPAGNDLTTRGGMVATVNVQDGLMTRHRSPASIYEPVTHHPDTGQKFVDMQLPDWEKALELTVKLHTNIKGYVFIGWDIALTPDGPVFLEGNSSWNAQQHQESCPEPTPLGRTEMLEIAQTYWR